MVLIMVMVLGQRLGGLALFGKVVKLQNQPPDGV